MVLVFYDILDGSSALASDIVLDNVTRYHMQEKKVRCASWLSVHTAL
ncbi:predicted protein [Sclerotinia sclerotiorum 1980 UF-70]|uniref:Uncharacterized protein n=1 Tax=Sclerotinia sclerotiorum (strain ATCC 18683 / 1980 / Ss-1) TaxID=665079 RepID=A7ESG2_SCLS1|nr:predicted protein [Sclerotinia sclerotiorum 1980 UF-70]EDN92404.1 predicted protein [Sclerotinia sclerotiorum 1980 UF-70]